MKSGFREKVRKMWEEANEEKRWEMMNVMIKWYERERKLRVIEYEMIKCWMRKDEWKERVRVREELMKWLLVGVGVVVVVRFVCWWFGVVCGWW